jgi:predicted kinase
MSRLIMITGIRASGKTQIAHALAARLPYSVHIQGDSFRNMLVQGQLAPDDPSFEGKQQRLMLYQAAAGAAKPFLAQGFTVIYEATVLGSDLSEVLDLHAKPLALIILNPHLDVIQQRCPEYAAGDLEHLHNILQYHTPRLGYWIDTSELNIAQSVDSIFNNLPNAAIL